MQLTDLLGLFSGYDTGDLNETRCEVAHMATHKFMAVLQVHLLRPPLAATVCYDVLTDYCMTWLDATNIMPKNHTSPWIQRICATHDTASSNFSTNEW